MRIQNKNLTDLYERPYLLELWAECMCEKVAEISMHACLTRIVMKQNRVGEMMARNETVRARKGKESASIYWLRKSGPLFFVWGSGKKIQINCLIEARSERTFHSQEYKRDSFALSVSITEKKRIVTYRGYFPFSGANIESRQPTDTHLRAQFHSFVSVTVYLLVKHLIACR